MKKICLVLFLFIASCNVFASSLYEIELERYLNDANTHNYNIGKKELFKSVKASELNSGDNRNFKDGDFSLTSTSEKVMDYHARDGVEQKTSAKYEKKYFQLSTGTYSYNTNPNLQGNTGEVFVAPALKSGNGLSLELNNALDTKGKYFKQELGLKYTPKTFKNSSVGITGSSKYYKDATRSDRAKFSADFYLF